MKLVFSIKQLGVVVGGAERVLCMVSSELARRGHSVTIITFDPLDCPPFFALDPRVKLISLGVGSTLSPTTVAEMVQKIRKLRQAVLSERPDVAVAFMSSLMVPLSFSLIGTGIPVVGSEHAECKHYLLHPLQYLCMLAASLFIAKITVLSECVRSGFNGLIRRRMVIIRNPVSFPEDCSVTQSKFFSTILAVGRLAEEKGFLILISAFARVATEFPTWNLKIVGEGPDRKRLEKIVRSFGLESRVFMPGVVANISEEYSSADIFVSSSLYEPFGLVMAEAMAHGLPVIGFARNHGAVELVENGRTGILIGSSNDIASLANALKILISDNMLRETLGKAGKEFVRGRYLLSQVCDEWEQLLCSLSEEFCLDGKF